MNATKHVVMFSGGIGSWMTARRVAEQYGTDNLTLLFADVKGDSTSPYVGESEDTYRFIEDATQNLGARLVTVKDGRDIWQVFKDNRFLGNSRLANCSKFLKQKPCREWLDANCDPENSVVYVGIDWTETHRVPAIKKAYLPYRAEAPLVDPPYLSKDDMIAAATSAGLEPPKAYSEGYAHNNCQGACVRAGQAQWELLLRTNPEVYRHAEVQEQELRDLLGKDVSILKRTTNSVPVPLTLRRFRQELEEQPSMFDEFDIGGCGCFVEFEDAASSK